MSEKEISWGKERGRHLYDISDKATRMIAERTVLEGLGLKLINLPLCSESVAVSIGELLPKAKEGFALALRAEEVRGDELHDLLRETTPETISGIWGNLALTERQNKLPEYHHVLATLALLLEMRKVSYFDFSTPPTDLSTDMGKSETYWNQNTSHGHIWSLMEELEVFIRAALYQKEPIGFTGLLKVGHFFAAGREVSKIFSL